jgi:hypothetical protein
VTSHVSSRAPWIIHNTGDGDRLSCDPLWQLPSLKVWTWVSSFSALWFFSFLSVPLLLLTFILVPLILCFYSSTVLHCFTFHLFITVSLCLFPNVTNYCIASLLPVSEVPDSNLGPETVYLDWGVLWFCLVPPGKFSNSIWNQETIASFHILPNSLFPNRPARDSVYSMLLTWSLNKL